MAVQFAPYEPATRCTSGAGNGARALMAAILKAIPGDKDKNWGIFNCRNTALGNRSAHGEGRALDIGCDLATGRKIVKLLKTIGPSRLGISVIIHDRVIYSGKSPNGRKYPGHPHHDHVHIEMTRNAAAKLNLATITRIILGGAPAIPPQRKPAPKAGSRVLKVGSKGADVKVLQDWLDVRQDGTFGSGTEAAVKAFQREHGLTADGIVGKKSWAILLKIKDAA